jgi:NADPH-dependent 2,4-dienoyl-CoA reductase/sulfur reductase-like enzyme
MRIDGKGLVDRTKPVRFRFDGKDYAGYKGDTVAAALLANDVRLMARSFKYHRPRGVLTAGSEEPNALVTVGRGDAAVPNVRATQAEMFDGLEVRSQNRWPSLEWDAAGSQRSGQPGAKCRILLQDLHVAARLLGRALRAVDPPCGGVWGRCRARLMKRHSRRPLPFATCW